MALVLVQDGALQYYRAENIPVSHGFTTRLGGVSIGILRSMNIGTHRGDSRENVLKNYEILGAALGFDPRNAVLTHQTHTDIVKVVDGSHRGVGLYGPEFSDCDALVTATPGLALVVFTADCTPILLYDPVTGAVGAAHAGWRGTAARIAEKAVKAMEVHFGSRPEDIRAAIGPNIGPCCFETDADVPQALLEKVGQEVEPFLHPRGNKFYPDLKSVNALILRQAGVQNIQISCECTLCREDLFWSHRRTGGNRGSQGAVIVCEEM